jgi:pimeloyl-ACP methyl ester carboxylesterase
MANLRLLAVVSLLIVGQRPPGSLIDLGGYKLHLFCMGKGRPTVILDSGMGDSSAVWSLIQPELSATTRVCSYDRAGTAWSDSGPVPRTMKQEVAELHELLRKAKEDGPFVLVGHSYAGLLARVYAAAYPSEVAGIVLVDSTHESTTLSVQRRGEKEARLVRIREEAKGRSVPAARTMADSPPKAGSADEASKMEAFIACLLKPGNVGSPFDRLPPEAQAVQYCARAHRRFSPQTEDYWPDELQAMFEERTRHPQPLGTLPLSVLAGGRRFEGMPKELQQEKDDQKEDLARLSSNSRFIRDPESGHHIHVENPKLVLNEIRGVIQAVLNRQPLSPVPR